MLCCGLAALGLGGAVGNWQLLAAAAEPQGFGKKKKKGDATNLKAALS